MLKHEKRLPREIVDTPSTMETFQQLDRVEDVPAHSKGDGLQRMTFTGPSQSKPFQDSITLMNNLDKDKIMKIKQFSLLVLLSTAFPAATKLGA